MKFLGRIKHCYHKERDEKFKKKQENEELIKQLEEEEQRLMDKL
jgi:hypothetical protein